MAKRSALTVLSSSFVLLLLALPAAAAPGGRPVPDFLTAAAVCAGQSQEGLAPSAGEAEGAARVHLPDSTPKPMPMAPWICGNCSESSCLDLYEGADCEYAPNQFGTCYASLSTLCSTLPKRYRCSCHPTAGLR